MTGIEFVLSIASSLAATGIVIVSAAVVSQRARFAMTALTSGFLGIDTEYVFPNRVAAQEDMEREFLRSSFVNLLTGRGQELQIEPFSKLLGERPTGLRTKFRVLLPQLELSPYVLDWTEVNEKELKNLDPAYPGLLRSQISATEKVLSAYQSELVEMRHFNAPHIGRVMLTDRVAYFVAYDSTTHSRSKPVIKIRAGGVMYDCYLRFFQLLWDNSPEASANTIPKNEVV